ncbi:outer membrane phospholipase A [Herbaspirillum seropedicae]|uniref:phospholipase A n=1 Tax=Herbaspirillum seropedicae TaxID=964 RepID=UPI00285DCAB1|nr:phospholipase A [Herbaspirillum seropedicae]MDR6397417.1 outer membrane phospholipase A [Herbaspirillum seropedicae]
MFNPPHRLPRLPLSLRPVTLALCALGGSLLIGMPAHAGITLVQPPKRIDASKPLELTLLVSEEDQPERTYTLPSTLLVAASADMIPPQQISLQRVDSEGSITLRQGQFRKLRYRGMLPERLRGMVRIEPIGMDAAPVLVAVVRPDAALGALPESPDLINTPLADSSSTVAPVAPSATVFTPGADASPLDSAPAAEDILSNNRRLSFNEPMYFSVGNSGGDTNARFQLSLKFRLFVPDDPRSRGPLDNLYLGYTQFSLWDLSAPSAPFRDTSYRPSLFYYLPDVGIQNRVLSRIGIATGLEHESNGRDGAQSRSINTYFIEPSFNFGNLNDYHFKVAPKVYAYLGPTRDNPDIGDYRGHMDLKLSYGKPDGLEVATMLRKGRLGGTLTSQTQVSYPLSRLLPGTAGYLMASYFHGYGESLLTYNQKDRAQFRIGYALWR